MQRPAVAQLPPDIRSWLEQELIQGGFADYSGLAERLNGRLADAGREEQISRSALHRYGQRLERRVASIKASGEAARAIAEASPDEEDSRSAAVISLVQSDLFDALLALQEAEDAEPAERVKLLAQAGKAIADVSRASISQKKFAAQVREKAEAAAASVETIARKGGLSADTVAQIRREILGIAA